MEDLEQLISSEEDRRWCVYIHRNKINNKAYIGITSQNPRDRWRNGDGYLTKRSDGSYEHPVFAKAIKKYSWDNFEHIIWAKNLTEGEAKTWEVRLIALFKTNCNRYKEPECGYNLTDGGDGMSGFKLSEEAKRKISKAKSGKPMSEEQKEKISAAMKGENNPNYGKHHSEQAKEKIGKAAKGNKRWLGKHHSEETRKKMSDAKINMTDETRKKLSDNAKERFKKPENNPNYGNGRHVVQLSVNRDYIAEYISATEAQRITGINQSSIIMCCKHQKGRKTSGGFKWMFKEEYNELNKKLEIKGEK